jgi:putative Mg2+ transporter-C (MgtC) family protein
MLSHADMILRMAAGAALGGVIGYERDRHGRPVGLRTHILVALSASTFMVVSSQFAYYQHFDGSHGIEVDASRIAASVVSAVGFLAGGSIYKQGLSVAGLTTAAGLWLVTAIGLCAGAGMYIEGASATAFGMLALTLVRRLEDKADWLAKRRIVLSFHRDPDATLERALSAIKGLGGAVNEIEYDRRLEGTEPSSVTINVTLPVDVSAQTIIDNLKTESNLERIQVRTA